MLHVSTDSSPLTVPARVTSRWLRRAAALPPRRPPWFPPVADYCVIAIRWLRPRPDPIPISGATMRPGTDLRQQYSRRISPCTASAGATTAKEAIRWIFVSRGVSGGHIYFNHDPLLTVV